MIFKQENQDGITVVGKNHKMPAPEVGKVYKAFDDGKIRLSRLDYWHIDRAIDLDKDEVDQEVLDELQEEIETCYWLYDKEQHIIYEATMVNKDGSTWFWKDDTEPTKCYFLYTQQGDWFGTGFLIAGLLDVDGHYYNWLMESMNE